MSDIETSRGNYGDVITMMARPQSNKGYFKDIFSRTRDKTVNDLTRLSQMFKITGGSKTLPWWRIKMFLLTRGYGAVSVYQDKVYFWPEGTPGGMNGQLLEPTKFTFANAYTGADGTLTIGEDCVLWRNDHNMQGVLPILDRYNLLISHTELSIYMALVNSRLQNIGLAGRDAEAKALEMVFDSIEDGAVKSIVDKNMLNKTTTLPNAGQTNLLTDLIEMVQYLRAVKWNELGLNMNWNAKRESLSGAESLMNTDALMPFVEDMLESWQEAADEINEKFGEYLELGPIKVELANAWDVNETEQETHLEQLEDAPVEDTQTDETDETKTEEDEVKEDGETD